MNKIAYDIGKAIGQEAISKLLPRDMKWMHLYGALPGGILGAAGGAGGAYMTNRDPLEGALYGGAAGAGAGALKGLAIGKTLPRRMSKVTDISKIKDWWERDPKSFYRFVQQRPKESVPMLTALGLLGLPVATATGAVTGAYAPEKDTVLGRLVEGTKDLGSDIQSGSKDLYKGLKNQMRI